MFTAYGIHGDSLFHIFGVFYIPLVILVGRPPFSIAGHLVDVLAVWHSTQYSYMLSYM